MKNFAIIANPRTGSTAIANCFRDIGIHLGYEPFRPDKQFSKPLSTEYIENYLTAIFLNNMGLKHVTSHVTTQENIHILHWLGWHEVSTILLRRNNIVMQAISLELAKQTGTWELQHGDTGHESDYYLQSLQPIDIDVIHRYIDAQNVEDQILAHACPTDSCLIFYEDLFSERRIEVFNELLNYLEADRHPLWEVLANTHFGEAKRQNTPTIFEHIPNWKEIKHEFFK